MAQFKPRATRLAQKLRNNSTDAERRLWRHFSRRQLLGFKFSRQMPIGSFICDFLCREQMLIVELDGGQHCENPRDEVRTNYLNNQGYRVIRFWTNEVFENLEGVLLTIASALQGRPLNPLPQAGGETAA